MNASEKSPSSKPGKPATRKQPSKQTKPLQPTHPASPKRPAAAPAQVEHFAERHDDPAQADELERQQDA